MDSPKGSAASSDLYSPLESASGEECLRNLDPCRDTRYPNLMMSCESFVHGLAQNETIAISSGSLKRKRDVDVKSDISEFKELAGLVDVETKPYIAECSEVSISSDLSVVVDSTSELSDTTGGGKRLKLDNNFKGSSKSASCHLRSSAMLAAVWQHIFCSVPPLYLGRLLLVNRAFNTYLTQSNHEQGNGSLKDSVLQPISGNAIWLASRRHFCPGLPRPITGMTELTMWQLLRGQNCQICNTANSALSPSVPWESGPGPNGVRIMWAFGLRCCGSCLTSRSKKVCTHIRRQ